MKWIILLSGTLAVIGMILGWASVNISYHIIYGEREEIRRGYG